MKTPYFIIDEPELDKNIDDFSSALKAYWPNSRLAYSVKTNSLPWVVSHVREKGCMGEVVSCEELTIARLCGYDYGDIIYNGPIKDEDSFIAAVKEGAIVNIDSQRELRYIKTYELKNYTNIGVRVNLDLTHDCPDDIGYHDDGFRFGFSETNGELEKAVGVLRSNGIEHFGLHFHCNSITRSVKVYESIARHAVDIVEKFNLVPSFIDIGGGFFGGVPGKPSADEYLKRISIILKKALDTAYTKLFIEPGSAIIASPVEFVTSVLDVKDTAKARMVTTDGSRINIDPLWSRKKYLCSYRSSGQIMQRKQIVCGYTCMDHDRIMEIENAPELSEGDEIIYQKIGAYSMTFGGPFIRFFPEVYVKKGDEIHKVRSYMDSKEYIKIHS